MQYCVSTTNFFFSHSFLLEVFELGKEGCLRCLLLVMCTHPFAKEALTLYFTRSEGHERYFGCNLMHRRILASSHQHLMAEAPREYRHSRRLRHGRIERSRL